MEPPEPAAGSDFYYACLYGPKTARSRLVNINALQVEISTIPLKVSDRGIARVKLNWWHEETAQLAAGTPRHQLAQSYHRRYSHDTRLAPALRALVDGLDQELGGRVLQTRDDQSAWFDATFGPIYALYAAGDVERSARALGSWIETAYALLLINPIARKDLYRLPQSSLLAAGCSWDDLRAGTGTDVIARLIGAETNYARNELATLMAATPRNAVKNLRVLLTWARILERALAEMQRDGCRVWLHRVDLTPVRKLWCAWRTRWL